MFVYYRVMRTKDENKRIAIYHAAMEVVTSYGLAKPGPLSGEITFLPDSRSGELPDFSVYCFLAFKTKELKFNCLQLDPWKSSVRHYHR